MWPWVDPDPAAISSVSELGVAPLLVVIGPVISSTAFGLQIFAERRELQSPHGWQAFATALFRDLVAIPLHT